jgi:hypothetical protein
MFALAINAPFAEKFVVEALPVTERSITEAPVAERLVVDALRRDDEATVRLSASIFVVDAFIAEKSVIRPRLKVSPVPERLVVDAFIYERPVPLMLLIEALLIVAPKTLRSFTESVEM